MSFSITINGNTYTDANFNGNNYAQVSTGLPQLLADIVAHVAGIFSASSSSSISVTAGTIAPTITINRPYLANQVLKFQRISDSTCYLQGNLNSYNPATGAANVTISNYSTGASGSGPFSDWVISVLGIQGPTGAAGAPGAISGGTVSGTIAMAGGAINTAGTTVASASTMNIGAATANYLTVTGTTTINGFDIVQAGTERVLYFQNSLTLSHNAASLILPGSASIVTNPGDTAIFVSEGSGNWRCVDYATSYNLDPTTARARRNQRAYWSLQAQGLI